ncbi:hypothetical protein [Xylella fastidiosa]|nr:hypothetical protein [Xylella fastidiosa]
MNHEIRAPHSNSIIPILEVIAENNIEHEQRDLLQNVTENTL